MLVEARRTRDLQLLSVDSAGGDRTLSLPGFTRLFLRFDAGGGLFGIGVGHPSDGETPVIPVYAPPGEPLAEVTLPEGAFGFRMADGRHGIALGETLDKVWVSTDGARSWERLTLLEPATWRGWSCPSAVVGARPHSSAAPSRAACSTPGCGPPRRCCRAWSTRPWCTCRPVRAGRVSGWLGALRP